MRSSVYSRTVGYEVEVGDVLVDATVVVDAAAAAVVVGGVGSLYVHSGLVRSDLAVRLRDFEQSFDHVRMAAGDEPGETAGIGVRMLDLAETHRLASRQTAGPQGGYVGLERVKEAD